VVLKNKNKNNNPDSAKINHKSVTIKKITNNREVQCKMSNNEVVPQMEMG
jgi:hypothetical protein